MMIDESRPDQIKRVSITYGRRRIIENEHQQDEENPANQKTLTFDQVTEVNSSPLKKLTTTRKLVWDSDDDDTKSNKENAHVISRVDEHRSEILSNRENNNIGPNTSHNNLLDEIQPDFTQHHTDVETNMVELGNLFKLPTKQYQNQENSSSPPSQSSQTKKTKIKKLKKKKSKDNEDEEAMYDSDNQEILSSRIQQSRLQKANTKRAKLEAEIAKERQLLTTYCSKPIRKGNVSMNDLLKRFGFSTQHALPTSDLDGAENIFDHGPEDKEVVADFVHTSRSNATDANVVKSSLSSPFRKPVSPIKSGNTGPAGTTPQGAKLNTKLATALSVDKVVPITDVAFITESNLKAARRINAQPEIDNNDEIELEIVDLVEQPATSKSTKKDTILTPKRPRISMQLPANVRSINNARVQRAKRNAELWKLGEEQLRRERAEEEARILQVKEDKKALKQARRKERETEEASEISRSLSSDFRDSSVVADGLQYPNEETNGGPKRKKPRLDQTNANDDFVLPNYENGTIEADTSDENNVVGEDLEDTRKLDENISEYEQYENGDDLIQNNNVKRNDTGERSQMKLVALKPEPSQMIEEDEEHHLEFLKNMTQDDLPADSQLMRSSTSFPKDLDSSDADALVEGSTDVAVDSNISTRILGPKQNKRLKLSNAKAQKSSKMGALDRFFNQSTFKDNKNRANITKSKTLLSHQPGHSKESGFQLPSGKFPTQSNCGEHLLDLLSGKFESQSVRDTIKQGREDEQRSDLISTQQSETPEHLVPQIMHDPESSEDADDNEDDDNDGHHEDFEFENIHVEPTKLVADGDVPVPIYAKQIPVNEDSFFDNEPSGDSELDSNSDHEANQMSSISSQPQSNEANEMNDDIDKENESLESEIVLLPEGPPKRGKCAWDDIFDKPLILKQVKPKSAFIDAEAEEEDDEFKGAGGIDGDVEDEDYEAMSADEEEIDNNLSAVIDLHLKQKAAADKKMEATLLEDITAGGMSRRRRERGGEERGLGWDTDSESDDELRRFKARYKMKGFMRKDDDGSEWTKLAKDTRSRPFAACFDESVLWDESDEEEQQIQSISATMIRAELLKAGGNLNSAASLIRSKISSDMDEYADEVDELSHGGKLCIQSKKTSSHVSVDVEEDSAEMLTPSRNSGNSKTLLDIAGTTGLRKMTSEVSEGSEKVCHRVKDDAPRMSFDVLEVVRDRNKVDKNKQSARGLCLPLGTSYMARTLAATKSLGVPAVDFKTDKRISKVGSGGLDGEVSKTARRTMAFQVSDCAKSISAGNGRKIMIKQTVTTKGRVSSASSSQTGRLMGLLTRSDSFT